MDGPRFESGTLDDIRSAIAVPMAIPVTLDLSLQMRFPIPDLSSTG